MSAGLAPQVAPCRCGKPECCHHAWDSVFMVSTWRSHDSGYVRSISWKGLKLSERNIYYPHHQDEGWRLHQPARPARWYPRKWDVASRGNKRYASPSTARGAECQSRMKSDAITVNWTWTVDCAAIVGAGRPPFRACSSLGLRKHGQRAQAAGAVVFRLFHADAQEHGSSGKCPGSATRRT